MTDREALARFIDPRAWQLRDMGAFTDYPPHMLRIEASLAKADQWLSRPSPVDGVVEAFRELITHFEDGENHNEGAFEDDCPDCRVLQRARDRLTAYDKAKGGV